MATITFVILVVGVVVAAYSDLRTRKISNALTGSMALSAIVISIFGGWPGVATATFLMLIVFAAGTLAFSFGWFGGGDVKLLAACSGLVGFSGFLSLLLYTLLSGGAVALVEAASRKRLRTTLVSAYRTTQGLSPSEGAKIPYGVAIAIGAVVYTLSTFPALSFLRLPL